MENLYITLDYGSSGLKCLYSKEATTPQSFMMEPEITEVRAEAIEKYRQKGKFQGEAIAHSFIGIEGTYYAVGRLAQKQFLSTPVLSDLKSLDAVQRTLAAVWVAAQKSSLSKKFRLFLSCLLPPGELGDQSILEKNLREALRGFDTPTGKHQISMPYFNCYPEGGGLSTWYQEKRGELGDRKLGVIMLGYRNASCFRVEKGVYEKFRSSEIGFSKIVSEVQDGTSGYTDTEITITVTEYLQSKNESQLEKILRQKKPADRETELEKMLVAIRIAKSTYWNALKKWLESQLGEIDELIVGGGVADLMCEDLAEHYRHKLPNLPGSDRPGVFLQGGLQYPANVAIPKELQTRFADAFCFWETDTYPNAVQYLARTGSNPAATCQEK
jgi:hypothetical protein